MPDLDTTMVEYTILYEDHKGNHIKKYIFAESRQDAIKFIKTMYRNNWGALISARLSPWDRTAGIQELLPRLEARRLEVK